MAANPGAGPQPSPYDRLPAQISSIGLLEVRPKMVWAAVLLALIFGPFGLLYCTTSGAIIMLIVSAVLNLLMGNVSFLIVLPVCAIWAWRAARESTSAFD